MRDCARNRAVSLPDKPAGTGVSSCESRVGEGCVADRRWRETIPASGSPVTDGHCSAKILESCAVPQINGSNGVTIGSGVAPMKSVARTDVGLALLRRRRTRVAILITAKKATAPPIPPPTIAPMFPFRFPCDDELFDGEFDSPGTGTPLAFIVWAGTLRKYLSQEREMEVPLCTNFRANGAYIAPSAGLIGITVNLVGTPDMISLS
jgi:hypothetical protein